MRNIDKYEEEIKKIKATSKVAIDCETLKPCKCFGKLCSSCLFKSIDCTRGLTEWLFAEYNEPILNEVEKRYLESVIRPFRDRVNCIVKSGTYSGEEYIYISIKNWNQSINYAGTNILHLPFFKSHTMYKGMEKEKEYTLKELGLFEGGKQ